MKLFLFLLLVSTSANMFAEDEAAPREAQSLGYGVMLYEYFQNHNFNALTEFAIAKSRDDLEGHGSHPQLMEGGISLAFGMDKKAEAIFQQLLDGTYTPKVEGQAWFYLAKIAYQRGQTDRAAMALVKAEGNLPFKFLNEFRHMRSNLAINAGKFKTAEQDIAQLSIDSPFAAYGSYNLAVIYQSLYANAEEGAASASLWQHAVMQFDKAAAQANSRVNKYITEAREYAIYKEEFDETDDTEEFKALADRASLAAGHVLIQAEQFDAAIDRFRKVRLDGPFAASAMLGYGWAAMELEHYQVALTPWQHLTDKSLIDSAVQESYLAIPHLYEKLEAPAQALTAYEKAVESYERELRLIDKAVVTLREADLLELFVVEQQDGFIDWVGVQDNVTLNPRTAYLQRMFARTTFQSVLSDLRDLHALQSNMRSWGLRVDTFDTTLSSRNLANAGVRVKQAKLLRDSVSRLQASRERLVGELKIAVDEHNAVAFLQGDSLSLHNRIAAVNQKAQKLQNVAQLGDQLVRSRFLIGVSTWDAHQAFPENKARAEKAVRHIDQALAKTLSRDALSGQNVMSNNQLSGYATRIEQAKAGLEKTQGSINASIARVEKKLATMAIDELLTQQKSIRAYLIQARLSITRLYDNGAASSGKREAAL